MNKTIKYISKCIKYHSKQLKNKLNELSILAVGIGDNLLSEEIGKEYKYHLFVLIDTNGVMINNKYVSKIISKKNFDKFLKWFRKQPFCESDYIFDDILDGHMHMIVIKIPDNCKSAMDKFRESKYSEMYTPEQIKKLFKQNIRGSGTMNPVFQVLTKDKKYRIVFQNTINRDFGTDVMIDEDIELDYPIKEEDEYFNYN